MELKDFKVGQVWRRRDGKEVVLECVDAAFHWPIADDGGGLYSASGAFHHGREDERDLVELVQDVEEPPAQTRLDAQLAGAMQASRGATAAELALFDAIVVAAMAPGCTNVNEYIYSALQLRRKLEQDISQ